MRMKKWKKLYAMIPEARLETFAIPPIEALCFWYRRMGVCDHYIPDHSQHALLGKTPAMSQTTTPVPRIILPAFLRPNGPNR